MGLSSEIYLSINGQDLRSPKAAGSVIGIPHIYMDDNKNPDEKTKVLKYAYPNGINSIGAILVPRILQRPMYHGAKESN